MKRLLLSRRFPGALIAPSLARQFAHQKPPGSAKHRVISSADKRFLAALQRFHELHGHFLVPSTFVVPKGGGAATDAGSTDAAWPPETWGLELGERLRTFTRGRSTQFKTVMLQSIGFPHQDWRAYVWAEQTLPAMRAFKRVHGHLFVRQSFQVPTEPDGNVANRWPRAAWGLKFGAQCQQLRIGRSNRALSPELIDELDRLGFIWSDAQWKWECQLLPALRRFHQLFGHVQVPLRFSVPDNDHQWPRAVWRYKLGSWAARAIDDLKLLEAPHNERAAETLKDLGFFRENAAGEAWTTRVLPCLEIYASLHRRGLLDPNAAKEEIDGRTAAVVVVPEEFVVPSDPQWPSHLWAVPLGYIVNCICNSVLFDAQVRAHKQQLQRLGYAWDALYSKWDRVLLPALIAFHREHGHCDVPANYVVPVHASPATSSSLATAAEYRLGRQVAALRRAGRDAPGVVDILDQLDAIGFEFDASESAFVTRVLPALRAYADKYGDVNVPQGFIVPSDDDAWPPATRGMKLGHIVRDIRSRRHYGVQSDAHYEELEALGFMWKLNRPRASSVAIDVVLHYWELYQSIHGSEDVPLDFVVPGDDPRWPREARHFGLGAWLQAYRQRISRAQLTSTKSLSRLERTSAGDEPTVDGASSDGINTDASVVDGLQTCQEIDGGEKDGDDDILSMISIATASRQVSSSRSARRSRRTARAVPDELPLHQEEYWMDVVLASFRAYASQHAGSCSDMDAEFVVPSEEPYPAVAWGLNLGLRLWHVKYGDRYAVEAQKYEAELRELGIVVEKPKPTDTSRAGEDGEAGHSEAV